MTWNLGLLMMCNERLENRLYRAATNDGLTNILNRTGFDVLSRRLLQRAARDRTPVSLLLMDLDFFKQINDRYGHDAGDRVLCEFAAVARRTIRPTDLLARYGGEEFCALLPKASEADALAVAERLRTDFATARLILGDHNVGTTVSIGVVQIAAGENVTDAMARADTALYLAKQQGRDRVMSLSRLKPSATPAPIAPVAA
jgi:diguanylate cyclase (GGDEF)-like protein